ncbi:MAG: MFS transporter [Caulobacteraceae bacterium]
MSIDYSRTVPAKVLWRVTAPFLVLSFLNSLDRSNISFAALRMNTELGFSHEVYGDGGSIFYLAYVLFQFPSMWVLRKLGGRRWLFGILLFWGLAASGMAFVQDKAGFYALRFLLGAAEAGFVPGVIYYASRWIPRRWRGTAFSLPVLAVPVSAILGGPLAGWLMTLANPMGVAPWRWLLLVEGLPTVLLAFIAPFYFKDNPRQAKWLAPGERDWLEGELSADADEVRAGDSLMDWSVVKDKLVWISAAAWFCIMAGGYGLNHWLPLVIKQLSGLTDLEVSILSAVPWIGIGAGMAFTAWHSDKKQERYWHVAAAAALGAVGLSLAIMVGAGWLGLILLMIAGFGFGGAQSTFFTIPTSFLAPARAAVAITLINVFGTSSGIIVPKMIGAVRDSTGSYAPALFPLAGLLVVAVVLTLTIRRLVVRSGRDRAVLSAAE